MPKYRSPVYNVNAILKPKTITAFGRTFAVDDGADGFSVVNVEAQQAPTNIVEYLEGNNNIVAFPLASNVSKLTDYALASFPNVETIWLFKNDEMVELTAHSFDNLSNLTEVYVPEELYDGYVATYPSYSSLFKKLVSTVEWVVPFIEGYTTLTKDLMHNFIGMLSVEKIAIIERIVIPADYEAIDDEALTELNQFTVCNTLVFKATFDCGVDILKGNTNIAYIDLESGNVNLAGAIDSTGVAYFKWLTPLTYMHDLIYKPLVNDYYITGYASVMQGNPMPSREEYGYWKWYSSPTTTDDTYLGDSETYPTATYTGKAYAFLILDTLIITGTDTLTSAIVENAINSIDTEISPLNLITRIVVGSGFTNSNENCMNIVDDYLGNNLTLILETTSSLYGNMTTTSKINKVVFRNVTDIYMNISLWRNKDYMMFYTMKKAEIVRFLQGNNSQFTFYANESTSVNNVIISGKIYLPELTTLRVGRGQFETRNARIFIGTNNCNANDDGSHRNLTNLTLIYLPANSLQVYRSGNNGGLWTNQYILDRYCGVIDGANIYQNIDDQDGGLISFNYPKLSATLTLDTSTGHLIENGVDLFAGYTATWYSDENCTQVISDLTTITESTTAYVKLTAI